MKNLTNDTGSQKSRTVIRTTDKQFVAYDRYGKILPGVKWLPLNLDAQSDREIYLIEFEPGSSSHPHIHKGTEEFLVLKGCLKDNDGSVFQPGDFVQFQPGSKHSSHSDDGCTLLVILTGGTNEASVD
ncbi:MAG: cupin [Acidiferrobacteraceae bacterium]|nr:cupin [Acidiferrobacteraceae bacterium]|tara:strand:- start:369 stop:752 length:384 start_codon:yes stop_codon:yes gene_type:complete